MDDPYEKSPRQVDEPVVADHVLSVSDLATALLLASNREVDEFNEILDRAEKAELALAEMTIAKQKSDEQRDKIITENEELLGAYRKMEKGMDTIMLNAKKHMQYAEQAKREKTQMEDKLRKSDMALAPYKVLGTIKKVREQIKAYKDKAIVNQKALVSGKEDIKVYRKDIVKLVDKIALLETLNAQSSIQTIWSKNGDHLLMFPTPLTMEINGEIEKQLTLLFMDNSGCGKLIGIDEDGEPKLCVMPKGGLKPKAATLAKAGNVLRGFKEKNWKVSHADLIAIQEK